MHTVPLTHQLVTIQDDFDLDKIIESGQCFRPQKLADGRYRFLSGGALLYLTPLGAGQYDAAWYGSDWECWANYFDLGRNYAALRCSLAGQSNYLDKSLDFGQGIRILHQDPWEMLITFLISQRKSIPAIRTAVERLARCCGEPLSAEGDEVFLFPTPQQLCGLSGAQPIFACVLRSTIDHQTATDFIDQTFVGAAITTKSASEYAAFASSVAVRFSSFSARYFSI